VVEGLIAGKVAVITGAGSGVGRAAVQLFTEHGARVIAADIDRASVEESVALAGKAGGEARAVVCNVTDETAVIAAVKAAVDTYGRLDIMYNNAGITASISAGGQLKTILDASMEEIQRIESVNVHGVIFGCRAAIRQFVAQNSGGAIVNTASIAGLIGFGGAAYGATKGAVVSLTRALAIEWGAHGIRVNSVCPAGMLTHFGGLDPDSPNAQAIRSGMGSIYPLGRAIDPRECAGAALFLASDLANSITGVSLPVDAGLSAGVKIQRRK
jgi:NAD(P)-dependent dehydrogenase (short-subunit alcohol dehydrogenase family)